MLDVHNMDVTTIFGCSKNS